MKVQEILEIINDRDIIDIMTSLGSGSPMKVHDGWLFQTICHNKEDGKKKLHYHSDTKTFYCYTECGNLGNIFSLVMKVRKCAFKEAYLFICEQMNISVSILRHGFNDTSDKVDISFINKFKKKQETETILNVYDDKVLNNFELLYHQNWIDDNISIKVMKEFGIRFDIMENRIIIPHYDIDGKLIGIRCRNFNEHKIEEGKKYMPIVFNKQLYNYPTSLNLFGLYQNKENIKKYKKIILVESEKAVMQHKSYFENSVCVACSGSALSKFQIELLHKIGVETIILALDKEYDEINTPEEELYRKKIKKMFIDKLIPYFNLEIIWDCENIIEKKMSPTDAGKEVFLELYKKRIML